MKYLMSVLASVLFVATANARGPSVSGGVPPHPALTTMSIVAPEAGVDYPTDGGRAPSAVLALYGKRVAIFDVVPQIVRAEAGIDFPTDFLPFWAELQGVLVLDETRVPVRLSYGDSQLTWEIRGEQVRASNIVAIKRAEAGVDYPTDGPANMSRPAFIVILVDGNHIAL